MKFGILFICSLSLVACDAEKKEIKPVPPKVEAKKEPRVTDAKPAEEPKPEKQVKSFNHKEVKSITFDKSILPKSLNFEGDIISGEAWEDSKGDNYLVFSKVDKKAENTLYINHFRINLTGTKVVKNLKEYLYCDTKHHAIKMRKSVFAIHDLDKDGIGEATFGYTVECEDGAAPTYKLFVLENGDKYKLTGKLTRKGKKAGKAEPNPLAKSHAVFLNYLQERWKE